MAKVHECSLAAVCVGVHKEERREVVFNSPRIQTCGVHREKTTEMVGNSF